MSSMASLRAKIALATVVFALGAGACSSAGMDGGQDRAIPDPASSKATATTTPGQRADSSGPAYDDTYNFTATTFDGDRFELAAHKGTPVVINFWESW